MSELSKSLNTVARDEVNLFDYLSVIWTYRWLIITTVVVIVGFAAVVSFILTPVYRAEVLIAPASSTKLDSGVLTKLTSQLGGLANLVGVERPQEEDTAKYLAMLKSRLFSDAFIREKNLMPVIFSNLWDAEANKWATDDPDKIPTMREAYKEFDEDIRRVDEDAVTGLIKVSISLPDRDLAAQLANDLVADANLHVRQIAVAEANKSIDYLNRELPKAGAVEIKQAIYRLLETQIQQVMLANVREEFAFTVIDPAVSPDIDDFVWPNRPLFIVVGLLVGVFAGVAIAFSMNLRRATRIG